MRDIKEESHTQPIATEEQQYGKLQVNSVKVHHKAYPNAQLDGLCKEWTFVAGDLQECLWYHRKIERGLLCAQEQQNWLLMDLKKKVCWFDESYFLFHLVDGKIRIWCKQY